MLTVTIFSFTIKPSGHRIRFIQDLRRQEEVLQHHQQEAEPQEPGAARSHVRRRAEVVPCSEVANVTLITSILLLLWYSISVV